MIGGRLARRPAISRSPSTLASFPATHKTRLCPCQLGNSLIEPPLPSLPPSFNPPTPPTPTPIPHPHANSLLFASEGYRLSSKNIDQMGHIFSDVLRPWTKRPEVTGGFLFRFSADRNLGFYKPVNPIIHFAGLSPPPQKKTLLKIVPFHTSYRLPEVLSFKATTVVVVSLTCEVSCGYVQSEANVEMYVFWK